LISAGVNPKEFKDSLRENGETISFRIDSIISSEAICVLVKNMLKDQIKIPYRITARKNDVPVKHVLEPFQVSGGVLLGSSCFG
jgi:hypothetical protein